MMLSGHDYLSCSLGNNDHCSIKAQPYRPSGAPNLVSVIIPCTTKLSNNNHISRHTFGTHLCYFSADLDVVSPKISRGNATKCKTPGGVFPSNVPDLECFSMQYHQRFKSSYYTSHMCSELLFRDCIHFALNYASAANRPSTIMSYLACV